MPQLDPTHFPSQLFWLCITFGLLYVCIQFWIAPKIKKGLHVRHHYIDHKLQEISSFQKKIEQLEERREQVTQQRNEEMALNLEKARARHKEILEKEREKLKKELHATQETFKEEIKAQTEQVAQELQAKKKELVALAMNQISSTQKKEGKHDSA